MGKMEIPDVIDPEIGYMLFPLLLFVLLLLVLAVCDGWPEGDRTPVDDHLRPLFLSRHQGTFESFRRGPDTINRKTASSDTMQGDFASHRAHIYGQLLRTAPSKIWKTVALSMAFTLGTAWALVNGVHYDYVELSSVFRSFEACGMLMDAMLPLTSTVLAFFLGLRLFRFQQVVSHVSEVSGALEDIALAVGCSVKDYQEDEDVKVAMWILYRHLNLVHILIYMQISRRFEHHDLNDLMYIGFISEAEVNALENSIDPPGLATFWIGHFMMDLHNAEVLDVNLLSEMVAALSNLRTATSSLVQEVARLSPITFVQIIQFAIDLTCLLTTPVLLHKFLLGRSYSEPYVFVPGTSTMTSTTTTTSTTTSTVSGVAAMSMMFTQSRISVYMMPVLGTFLVVLLYQGAFQTVKDTEDPFGIGMDRLNPDIILDKTEKRIAAYLRKLSGNIPKVDFSCLNKPAPKEDSEVDETEVRDVPPTGGADGEPTSDASKPAHPPLRQRSDSNSSGSACATTDAAVKPGGRPSLPTSVILCPSTIDKLMAGAHEDAIDLHRGVHDKLTRLETGVLLKLEEDDPYLVAVTELLAKLQQESLANAQLREEVISAVAGMSRIESVVLENPSSLRRNRSNQPKRIPAEIPAEAAEAAGAAAAARGAPMDI